MPQTPITWATGDYRGNYYDDFNGDFNSNYYDYSSSVADADTVSNYDYYNGQGITGVNVLNEMRPNPTRPGFITGSNVIRYRRIPFSTQFFIDNFSEMRPTRPNFITGQNVIK